MSAIKRRASLATVLWLVFGLFIDLNPLPSYPAVTVVVTMMLFAAAVGATASITAIALEDKS